MKDISEPALVKIELTPRELYIIAMAVDPCSHSVLEEYKSEAYELERDLLDLSDKYKFESEGL